MFVLPFRIRILTAATPLVFATPGQACEKSSGLPGAPCGCLTIAQDVDLSFSIRSSLDASPIAPHAERRDARTPIAIGTGLKADPAIFARGAVNEKEVSDAPHQ